MCDPDFCCWTVTQNNPPSGKSTNIRTGCCHVHVRYDNMTLRKSLLLLKAMDLFLGVPSIIIEPDNKRKLIYGSAGAYRFDASKTTEYRVLSNYFLNSEELRKWVYDNTLLAIDFVNKGYRFTDDEINNKIINSINNCNGELAMELINKFEIPMPKN